jgi:hypothetical protein
MAVAASARADLRSIAQRRRRWPRYAALLLVTAILAAYFAPALVLRTPCRDWLLRRFAPESAVQLQIDSISAGWRTPIGAQGVRYSSDSFEFFAESIQCDRTLFELLRDPTNLGGIRLASPVLSITPSSKTVEADSTPTLANQYRTNDAAQHRSVAVDLHITDAVLNVCDSAGGRTCVARDMDFHLNAPAGGDRATFRFMARTGDPKATAHASARGTLNWPCHSWRTALIELHADLVGVDASLAEQMIAAVGGTPAQSGDVREHDRDAGNDANRIRGRISGSAELRTTGTDAVEARANLEVRDFGFEYSTRALVTVSAVARFAGDDLHLDSGRISCDGVVLDVSGVVRDYSKDARAELGGFLLCDWESLAPRLCKFFSEDIEIRGRQRRPWRLAGPLRGEPWRTLARKIELDAGIHVESLRAYDFDLGPTELAAHWNDGSIEFEPIVSEFQRGQLHVQPSIRVRDAAAVIHVGAGRVIDRVALDPNLCEWILRYVDPLGTISRNLQGHLSLEIDELEIPLASGGFERGSISGRLLLENVQFAPEESLREILAGAGVAFRGASIRTDQTIEFRLADGRVHHSGLALPIADERVTLDGWVGLDQAIDIRLSLPVTEEMLGKDKRLYRLLRGQRIELPVTGTLENPKVSEDALARNIQRLIQAAIRENLGDDPLRGLLRRALK